VRSAVCGSALAAPLALALFASACGDGDSGPSEAERQQSVTTQQREQAKAKAERVASACESATRDFLDALHEMNSRLDIGLTYADYGDRLGDVKVEYDTAVADIGDGADAAPCLLGVGVPAEEALNYYTKAQNRWSRCTEDIDCDSDSIKDELQRNWSRAGRQIDRADSALRKLREPE